MGNKFSRKRDASANSAEAAEEPTAALPEEPENQPGTTQEHDADDKQDLVVMSASPVASLPKGDCVWESREVKEGEEGTPDPADPSVPEPDPATGALVCPPEPETTINPAGPPVDPEPASGAQGQKDTVTVETIPDPTLVELGDPAPGPNPTLTSVNPDDELRNNCEVTPKPLRELMEAELTESSQEASNDVEESGVDKLLENLELTGGDLNADTDPL